MSSWAAPQEGKRRKEKRVRRARLSGWHKFVLLVGYAALLYGAARGVIYLLVLLEGKI